MKDSNKDMKPPKRCSSPIIADVRQQAGMTLELAQRAARRAYGADIAARIQSIRLIGQGFDVSIPRLATPPVVP